MQAVIAKMLLQIGAVIIRPQEPFTWTSGIQSPMYCDNRLTISYPQVRKLIASEFADLIQQKFGAVDVIAGTSTAGIPHAAFVSDLLQVPMAYVRDKAKGHGKQGRIEGRIRSTDRVVVIEDTFSTGGSSLAAAQAIVEDAGASVVGVAAIYSYEFSQCEERFRAAGLPFYSLTGYSDLMRTAVELGLVTNQQANLLSEWKNAPDQFDWAKLNGN